MWWWRWWVGIRPLRTLITSSTFDQALANDMWGRGCQICWFYLDFGGWYVIQGKLFLSFWCDFFISSFIWVCGKILFLQPSGLVVKEDKPLLFRGVSLGNEPLRLFDLIVNDEWLLRSSKPCWPGRWRCPIFFYYFCACFKPHQPLNNRRKKTRVWFSLYFCFILVVLCELSLTT
jgi:hypothetical protein